MADQFSLRFRSAPSIVPSYLRVVFIRKLPLLPEDQELPHLEAVLEHFEARAPHVDSYRAVCGGSASEILPVAYPHVLAMPVQLALMASSAFPVRIMGLVHLRNHIEQRRPLRVGEAGRLRVWIDGHRETGPGQEFDVNTSVEIGGQDVWRETCVFMARRMKSDAKKKRHAGRIAAGEGIPAPDAESLRPVSPESIRTATFAADDSIGWRYARVSSDFNPIHLSKTGARMFGFEQPIAHGMWSMARCLAALDASAFEGAKRVDVVFKRPVMIPAPLTVETWYAPGGAGFALKGTERGKLHVAGSVTPLAAPRP